MLRPALAICCCLLIAISATGCRRRGKGGPPDYARALPAGQTALVELRPEHYPRFTLSGADIAALDAGIGQSLTYLSAPSAAQYFPLGGITQEQVRGGLTAFRALMQSRPSDQQLNEAIRRDFRVFTSRGWDDQGTVLFTGYYTPIFPASRTRTERFQYPLYKRPQDLVPAASSKQIASQRQADGSLRPYPARQELLASGKLNGSELVWFETPFDAYTVLVQGSGRLRLTDGSELEIGYDGTNGHEYVGVASQLVRDGHMAQSDISLQNLRQFFLRNPHLVEEYLNRNPRYVFFTETKGGPYGSLGRPVTADVTIATDKDIFPRGALTYVSTQSWDGRVVPYNAFRLDQDTGGAIRAPGKCDLYMGIGAEAEARAGKQLAEGRLYYLLAQ